MGPVLEDDMRLIFGITVALVVTLAIGCAGRKKQQSVSTVAPPAHWTAKVCTSVKDRITLLAGPSKDDVEVFGTWRFGEGQTVFDLPARVQQLTELYVKASTVPQGKNAQLCVRYDGHPKKAYNFSGSDEDHEVKSSDSDDSNCRC